MDNSEPCKKCGSGEWTGPAYKRVSTVDYAGQRVISHEWLAWKCRVCGFEKSTKTLDHEDDGQ